MPLIQEIWVINDAGVIIFNLQLGGTPLQKELLGGFIAALEKFTDNLSKADLKSIIFGSTRFTICPLGISEMILAIRTETTIQEKKVNKILLELREKLNKYLQNKLRANPEHNQANNLGFSLEFDDAISEIFLKMQ